MTVKHITKNLKIPLHSKLQVAAFLYEGQGDSPSLNKEWDFISEQIWRD